MKKFLALTFLFTVCSVIFAASYLENNYQVRSRMYTKQANEAFDAGEYEQAIEFSHLAEENAELSRAYIKKMMAKAEADQKIRLARNRITWSESINAQVNFPMAYSAAKTELDNAVSAYDIENYEAARDAAQRSLDALASIREVTPLPKYYVVRPWAQTKDCYWNISGRPYIYNNPRLWENLYQANKDGMSDPANPNLIHPGMKMLIPSLSGEFRDGTYDPKQKYEAYGK
jgi:nucleoid-associated protein YgaU